MKRVMVRYKVKAGRSEENRALVRAVYEELRRTAPAGLRYATLEGPDGVSFVHLASIETTDGANPLTQLSAFQAFSADIKERCEEPPQVVDLTEVDSYRFFGGSSEQV